MKTRKNRRTTMHEDVLERYCDIRDRSAMYWECVIRQSFAITRNCFSVSLKSIVR